MRVLGISGGLDRPYENRAYLFPRNWSHDAASVLVEDGRVTAAIEEERLNRIKHTSKGAVSAIRFCLAQHGMRLNSLDYLAMYGTETIYDNFIRNIHYGNSELSCPGSVRELVHSLLIDELADDIDDEKLIFVPHHLCHLTSTYFHSGYRDALILTIDGGGDGLSGTVSYVSSRSVSVLQTYPIDKSLGVFYDSVIAVIGYGFTEEYKVMGLAPYGDPSRFRQAFRGLYALLPRGDYLLRWDLMGTLFELMPARKKQDPLEQRHADFAAALQEALEDIVFHVVSHFRDATGGSRLCLAGGVAHNCSLNGKLLYSGLFEDIFVHPASHDAGCAVGAAVYPFLLVGGLRIPGVPAPISLPDTATTVPEWIDDELRSVFWGPHIGADAAIQSAIAKWRDFVEVEVVPHIAARTAAAIVGGAVIGWVQGRSEFGPRALGNRSIVADPRRAENKDIVNAMVKKREAYRPFAPAVLENYAHEFFDLPPEKTRFPFMTFVVRVRPEKRDLLPATTHVDGTARIQTVSRDENDRFWQLIEEFRCLTGIPVLLNTSFNNNREPIVDSIDDAVVAFLTTGLTHLVIGNAMLTKKPRNRQAFTTMYPSFARHLQLLSRHSRGKEGIRTEYFVSNTYDDSAVSLSSQAHLMLSNATGCRSIADLLDEHDSEATDDLLNEIYDLWSTRVIQLSPAPWPVPDDKALTQRL